MYQVYLAGPISGLSLQDGVEWREYASAELMPAIECLSPLGDKQSHVGHVTESTIECLSPLRGKQYLAGRITLEGSYEQYPLSTQRAIYARDKFDCHRADLILVNLLGATTVSIGTVMEIAWAAQAGKPIVLIIEKDNIHEHPMLKEACPFIVDKVDDGIALVNAILLAGVK